MHLRGSIFKIFFCGRDLYPITYHTRPCDQGPIRLNHNFFLCWKKICVRKVVILVSYRGKKGVIANLNLSGWEGGNISPGL